MKRILIIPLLLLCSLASAQDITPKHTFNIELGLPNSMSNKSFSTIMQGLVNVSPYYQFAFENSLAIGIGVKYTYFDVNEFKVPEPVFGGIHSGIGFVKIGREKFHSGRFGTDMGVKIGAGANIFSTDQNKLKGLHPRLNISSFVEPMIGLILSADEFTSYRLNVGYAFQGYAFSPQLLGMDDNGGYNDSDVEGSAQYLTIGFGFTYYFKSK